MSDDMGKQIRASMRSMAWERAKGELQSMLHTFYGERERFEALQEQVNAFIAEVEDNGMQE